MRLSVCWVPLALVLSASAADASIITLDTTDPITILEIEDGSGAGCTVPLGDCGDLELIRIEDFLISNSGGLHFHTRTVGVGFASTYEGDGGGVAIRHVDGLPFTPVSATVFITTPFPVYFNTMLATAPVTTFAGPEWEDITTLRFYFTSGPGCCIDQRGIHLISLTVDVPAVPEPSLLLLVILGATACVRRHQRSRRHT